MTPAGTKWLEGTGVADQFLVYLFRRSAGGPRQHASHTACGEVADGKADASAAHRVDRIGAIAVSPLYTEGINRNGVAITIAYAGAPHE